MDDLHPGVTEMYVHPAVDTPELRAHAPDWKGRVDDLDLVSGVGLLAERLRQAGAHVIGYRPLRELQRAG
jgi:chitin disaccharide deacetylase